MFLRQISQFKFYFFSVAFFSGVDIDKVMRKEPTANCVTPSNPRGLLNGYGVPVGECLTINDLIEKTQK